MKNISLTDTEPLFVENFCKLFTSCDTMKCNTEVNAAARDKKSGSHSRELTFDILKLLRNSIKNGLTTSGSSNCDILGGQEAGSFSFTFPTNLLAQTFIRVSSVITMQEIASSTYELLLNLSQTTSDSFF